VGGGSGTGPTGTVAKGTVLPLTGAGPWLMGLFGAGVLLMVLGLLFFLTGRSRARSVGFQRPM
jgi:LPXTG-motif cell wall-anchored protein